MLKMLAKTPAFFVGFWWFRCIDLTSANIGFGRRFSEGWIDQTLTIPVDGKLDLEQPRALVFF